MDSEDDDGNAAARGCRRSPQEHTGTALIKQRQMLHSSLAVSRAAQPVKHVSVFIRRDKMQSADSRTVSRETQTLRLRVSCSPTEETGSGR